MKPTITELALDNPIYLWIASLVCIAAGIYSIATMARLEDPPYPIKQAYVVTLYPGASAAEVEQEVTETIEASLQRLPWVDKLISRSLVGRSEIQIELKHTVKASETPQIWDVLRRRVADAAAQLPASVLPPMVEDDFADVFGLLYAINIPPDYSTADTLDVARQLSVAIKTIPHVAKIQLDGLPQEQVYLDIDRHKLLTLGIPPTSIANAVDSAMLVDQPGQMLVGSRLLRLSARDANDSLQLLETLPVSVPGATDVLQLRDLAHVSRGEVANPALRIRHNGDRVFTMGIAVDESQNIVAIGRGVESTLEQLARQLPVGYEVTPIYQQHRVVDNAVNEFFFNLLASIATVIAALCLFMGWRSGVVVGSVLLLTVLGTLAIMNYWNIQLQRISLGAMMIAMGMLVDNAIVTAEGMLTGIQRGIAPRKAAIDSVMSTRTPLLGATIIGVAAFAPIGLSSDSTGQYLGSLFQVAAISLLLSWLLAVTIVPAIGLRLLQPEPVRKTEAQLYSGFAYRGYRQLINQALYWRRASIAGLFIVLLASFWGAGHLKQGFFPTTNTPLFFVDINLPQGVHLDRSDTVAQEIANVIRQHPEVENITTWVGRGPSRFIMILLPERANRAYAQLAVRVRDVAALDRIRAWADVQLAEQFGEIEARTRRIEFSPGGAAKLEARFSGPSPAVLRALAGEAEKVFRDAHLMDVRSDWREKQLALQFTFQDAMAEQTGVRRSDVASSLAFNTEGIGLTTLRDGEKLVPVLARAQDPLTDPTQLATRAVWSISAGQYVPLDQVLSDVELIPENGMLLRRNRLLTITAEANPRKGQTAVEALKKIRSTVEAIPLPAGYTLEWGGEYESNKLAQESLGARFPLAMAVMILTTLLLFGKIRETLVVWLTVPMMLAGVVGALNLSQLSFTFPALLGLLSLVGIVLKNCVIMVEEIELRIQQEGYQSEPLLAACVSRLRPVMLAAATTVVGMSPLLADSFFREMAVCIMGGLAVGSLLSLVSVPVLYAALYRIPVKTD